MGHHQIAGSILAGTPYLHIIEGRIRVKVPAVRRAPEHAARVIQLLTVLDGVEYVSANTLTGNVLILHKANIVSHVEILNRLHCLMNMPQTSPVSNHSMWLFNCLMQSLVEAALEGMILAVL